MTGKITGKSHINGDTIAALYVHVGFDPARWYFLPPEGKTIAELIPERRVCQGEYPK